ncbi:MAG: response regulator, partial [Deltaproteobacteria bacterium]|nr:response regulator [Deltaproteobacteria bacterium]
APVTAIAKDQILTLSVGHGLLWLVGLLGIGFSTRHLNQQIAERMGVEETLRESEKKYRELADLLPQVVFETDEKATLTFANRIAFNLFGYTKKDFKKGLSVLEMLTPEDRDRAWENIQRILGGEKSAGTEYTALRKDGNTFPALIYSSPIISEGKPVGLRGAVADLSEVKRTQEALRKSKEKLARLEKMEALGLLAGGVAHDLNNVLSGIVSYPELILMDLPHDSKLRKPIETMQESGHRAALIVQDLLTVARGVASPKEPLNINTIVKDYLNSPEFEKLKKFHTAVTIKTDLDPDLLNTKASPVHIRKVIMNLVSNASEAIEGRGNVVVSTINRYVDRPLRGHDDVNIGEYAILSVSDDGPGISSDDLERIFDPFYTKKVMGRSGTGLGLSVVWNVIQDHEGYINVRTTENGTTFELYFPITRDTVSDKALIVPIENLKGDGETILVVDDVRSQREISCSMLDTLGYKALAVSSGEEAIEYLKAHTVDLIFLDMIMDPGINGRETYERIIKRHPNQKAIIVSGFAETDEVKKAQRLGAGQYIKKPLTLEKIGLAIKEEL